MIDYQKHRAMRSLALTILLRSLENAHKGLSQIQNNADLIRYLKKRFNKMDYQIIADDMKAIARYGKKGKSVVGEVELILERIEAERASFTDAAKMVEFLTDLNECLKLGSSIYTSGDITDPFVLYMPEEEQNRCISASNQILCPIKFFMHHNQIEECLERANELSDTFTLTLSKSIGNTHHLLLSFTE